MLTDSSKYIFLQRHKVFSFTFIFFILTSLPFFLPIYSLVLLVFDEFDGGGPLFQESRFATCTSARFICSIKHPCSLEMRSDVFIVFVRFPCPLTVKNLSLSTDEAPYRRPSRHSSLKQALSWINWTISVFPVALDDARYSAVLISVFDCAAHFAWIFRHFALIEKIFRKNL